MTGLPFSPLRLKVYSWHKWAGITILALSALRLLWRLGHPPPALPPGMSRLQLSSYRAEPHADVPAVLRGAADSAGPTARPWACRWRGSACCALPDFVTPDPPFAEAVLQPLHRNAPLRWRASRCCTWRPR
jgi:hypothetical protein